MKKKKQGTFLLSLASLLVGEVLRSSSATPLAKRTSIVNPGQRIKSFKMKFMDIIACQHGESTKCTTFLEMHFFLGGGYARGGRFHQPQSCALQKKDKILVEMTSLQTVFLRFYDLLLTFYCM